MNKIAATRIINVKPKQDNVSFFTGATKLDFSPDMLLAGALGGVVVFHRPPHCSAIAVAIPA